jgi:hypothetical protein
MRREHGVNPGDVLVWETSGPDVWRVRVERKAAIVADPVAMLGFARRFRETRRTEAWMRELRADEE